MKWTIRNLFGSFPKKDVLPLFQVRLIPLPVGISKPEVKFELFFLQTTFDRSKNALEEDYKQHVHYTKDNRCKPDRGIFISLQPSIEKILLEKKPLQGRSMLEYN